MIGFSLAYLTAVDLEEAGRYDQIEGTVARTVERGKHIVGGHRIDAVLAVLHLSIELTSHGVRLARSSLAVCKARGHAALKDCLHQRLGRVPTQRVECD